MLELSDTVSTVLQSAWVQIGSHCATMAEGSDHNQSQNTMIDPRTMCSTYKHGAQQHLCMYAGSCGSMPHAAGEEHLCSCAFGV